MTDLIEPADESETHPLWELAIVVVGTLILALPIPL